MNNIILVPWPDCETPYCPYKVCLWGSDTRCYPCEEKLAGADVMRVRYALTHQFPYHEDQTSNAMLRLYKEIRN